VGKDLNPSCLRVIIETREDFDECCAELDRLDALDVPLTTWEEEMYDLILNGMLEWEIVYPDMVPDQYAQLERKPHHEADPAMPRGE